ncbi:hypothetical protein H2198_002837 [Neophaeococcomyces mojaviensis]|uniref:Uncharacterized protein n=1 Tax=Neophaeococcomyces mojaviensis TaxID=3383035 RepID=A0ACC3AD57_9EURO|nr:hypothetical protein H2198_002837 [Knufia sp. JES_112]
MAKHIKSLNDVKDILKPNQPKKHHPSPAAWEDQVFYFLLPDRFSNGNETDQNIYDGSQKGKALGSNDDSNESRAWREAGTRFCGGTLRGLKSKLPYLHDLGITALWIGPIFKQVAWLQTYHGYGVQNFLDVDPRFGTREELQDLVEAAHSMERPMFVILDIILNHCGNVFEYKFHDPVYDRGRTYDVKGFYAAEGDASIPLGPADDSHFPNGAIWPAELQDAASFTRQGRINTSGGWDAFPEYLDGDFFDLKDVALGPSNADNFTPTRALQTLCEAYKYWIAFADIDGYRIDTVKHMGDGPTRYFCSVIHEYAQSIGKERFILMGEVTGGSDKAYETVEATGLDAALGIGNVQENLWKVPRGEADPEWYFGMFRNALYLNKGSHTWYRDKVVTMIDDHDQVWRGDNIGKGRFCSAEGGAELVSSAIMLNLCTLGVPCIYYGTEQAFDGSGNGNGADRYIRETMFGGAFGAFRSKDAHFFNERHEVYQAVSEVTKIRAAEIALRRGRQYLRDISDGEDGEHFGPTKKMGGGRIEGVVAWSRLFAGEEVLCAINTDWKHEKTVWVNIDVDVHPPGSKMQYLSPANGGTVGVEFKAGRSAVKIKVPQGGFVILK